MTQMNIPMKQNQGPREQTGGWQGEEGRRRSDWKFGIPRCTLVYIG